VTKMDPRSALSLAAGLVALGTLAVPAHAQGIIQSEGPRPLSVSPPDWVDVPPPAAVISSIIYLNRCGIVGGPGCAVTQSGGMLSNSLLNQTWLGGDGAGGGPGSGNPGMAYTLPAFPYSDNSWNAIVDCVRETYAPYNVTVTDVDPGTTTPHHEAIVAGDPADLGLPDTVGGVGPLFGNCSLHDNTISFTFATIWPDNPIFICSVVAQETAHGFGLEHSFNCADPLTYLNACGLQYFRNEIIPCGEFAERPCTCGGGQQNSHSKMLAVFGPNPTPLPTPTVTIAVPADGANVQQQFAIGATGVNKRGIGKAELWLNGYKWDEINATRGQTQFTMTAPANLPDGVIDVEVRLFNDLETVYGTSTVTVTKGAACTSADSCLDGQKCDGGRCYWDPPTGVLGDDCTYNEFCTSAICQADQCTVECNTGVTGDCPTDYECIGNGSGVSGYCLKAGGDGGGGCCSVTDDGPGAGALLAQLGLAGLVLGGVMRRRRRRA